MISTVNIRKVITISFFFLFSQFSIAQTVVTIDECQSWAVEQTSAKTEKGLLSDALKLKLREASAAYYPSLEMNGQISYQSDVTQLPYIPGALLDTMSKDHYRIGLDFSQTIYDGGKTHYGKKYAKLQSEKEFQKIDMSISSIKEKVIELYLNLLMVDGQTAIFQNIEETLQKQLTQVKESYKEGVVIRSTITQLELELLKLAQQKEEILANKKTLTATLSALTDKDLSNAEFTVPGIPGFETSTPSQRSEIKLFDNEKAGLDYQKKLFIAQNLPKVSLYASAGYGRPTYNLLSNNFDWFYIVGLKVNVPILGWIGNKSVDNYLEIQKNIIDSKKKEFEKFNDIAIQEKLNEIRKIERLIVLDKEINTKYKEVSDAFSTQLLNGTITPVDYLRQTNEEKQSLLNEKLHTIQLLKAKYEFLALKGNL